jgi:hypothetical protein
MEYEPDAAGRESYILCADCGTVISSANGAGLCKCSAQLKTSALFLVSSSNQMLTVRCGMSAQHHRYH